MKRIIVVLLLLFLVISIEGCSLSKKKYCEENIDEFDILLEEVKDNKIIGYDLRYNCEDGHMHNFICVRFSKTLDDIINDVILIYKKNQKIIFICSDGEESKYVVEELIKKGYKNICYFIGGYDKYIEIKKEDFNPEVGCNC